jgi:hypothetical protein
VLAADFTDGSHRRKTFLECEFARIAESRERVARPRPRPHLY